MQGYNIWPRKACLIEEQTYRNVDKATAATWHFRVQFMFFTLCTEFPDIWYTGNLQVEQVTEIKYLSCLYYPPAPVVQNSTW